MIALLVGIVFMILGVLGLVFWWSRFVIVLTGSLPPIFILSGLAALALGISQMRDKMAAKKEEEELAAEEAKAGPAPEPPKPEPAKAEAKPAEAPKEPAKPGEPEKKEEGGQ